MFYAVQDYPSIFVIREKVTYYPKSVGQFRINLYPQNVSGDAKTRNDGKKDILARISILENKHRSLVLTAKLAGSALLVAGLALGAYQYWGQISSAAHSLACKMPWISQKLTCSAS